MGALKIIVICAVIFVAICEEIKPRLTPGTIIDTRCKRETEIDTHTRELKSKVPSTRKPTRPVIPVTKKFNPINAYPRNALPRRNIIPLVIQSKVLNSGADSIKHSEADNRKSRISNNDTVSNNVESSITSPSNNSLAIENENSDDDIKMEEEEKCLEEYSEPIKIDQEIQVDEDKVKKQADEKNNQTLLKNEAETDIENNDKEIENIKVHKDIDQVLGKEVKKTPAQISIDKLSPTNPVSKFKIVPAIPTQKSGKLAKMINKPNVIEEREDFSKSKLKITPESLLNNNDDQIKEVSDNDAPKLLSLTILTDAGKIPINIAPRIPITKVPLKLFNESNYSIGKTIQKIDENQNLITTEKLEPDVKYLETGRDEIVIQNNNYEELYETTPEYINPKVIVSDLRSTADRNNFQSQSYNYEYLNTPQTYNGNNPYSYEIKKYPNQYVVNTYDDNVNRRRYYNNDLLNTNTNNQEDIFQKPYTKNLSPWSKQYKEPQTQGCDQRYINNIQAQEYPKRIWRSWKNNQIFIRPQLGTAGNTELYKGLGRYIANANVQSTPAYTINPIRFSSYENQNTSPQLNPFQYRRYGH